MITNMDYHDIFSYLMRYLLWALTSLVTTICDAVQSLFEKVFKLIGFFYSSTVLTYIQENCMPLIGVLLAVSFIMLGYNLMTKSDDSDRKGIIGAFSQNFILFLVIVFFIPLLLAAKSPLDSSGVYNLENVAMPYEVEVEYDENTYVPEAKGGLINLTKADALKHFRYTRNSSASRSILSKHVTDWLWVYNQISVSNNTAKVKVGDKTYSLTDGNAGKEMVKQPTKHYSVNDIIDLSINDRIVADDCDAENNNGTAFEEIEWEAVVPENQQTDTDDGKKSKGINETGNTAYYNNNDYSLTEYLFGYKHEARGKTNTSFTNQDCDSGIFGIDFLGSHPYRYSVDWLPMFIELIATTLVYFFIAFKTATLLWELAVNHILLYLFAAGDLTGGRKVREILKSIFSIFATIIFAYIDLQVFFMACDYLDTTGITGLSNSLIKIFFAYACIDGPQILERVFGIDAGLKRPAAVLAGAAAVGAKATKSAMHLAGKGTKTGATIGGYMAGKHKDTLGKIGGAVGKAKDEVKNKAKDVLGDVKESGLKDATKNLAKDVKNAAVSKSSSASNALRDLGKEVKDKGVKTTAKDHLYGTPKDTYKESVANQCKKDLGMNSNDAEKVANAMANEKFDPEGDYSSALAEAQKLVGDHIDYDKAIADESEGGLGLTADEAMSMKDNSAELGENYMANMDRTASEIQAKTSFNSIGSRGKAISEKTVQTNSRADALSNSLGESRKKNPSLSDNFKRGMTAGHRSAEKKQQKKQLKRQFWQNERQQEIKKRAAKRK